jgi:hypothetical protein
VHKLTPENAPEFSARITEFLSKGPVNVIINDVQYGSVNLRLEVEPKLVQLPNGSRHRLPVLTLQETGTISRSVAAFPDEFLEGESYCEVTDKKVVLSQYIVGAGTANIRLERANKII